MAKTSKLISAVAFDAPTPVRRPGGVMAAGWAQQHTDRAEVIYSRGSEVVEAARLEGRPIYKIRIRSCSAAKTISTDWRMRDLHRGLPTGEAGDPLPGERYSIREVDAITSPRWVFLVIEGGKAP